MMTQLEVVPPQEMEIPEDYSLYFISQQGNEVLRMDLDQPETAQRVSEVVASNYNDRLFVRPSDASGFDLWLCLHPDDRGTKTDKLVLEDFAKLAALEWQNTDELHERPQETWTNVGPVPSLALASDWEYRTGFWAAEGLSGEHKKTGEKIRFSLEIPFVEWHVRNATQLAGDFVIAQLGDDQICLIHPASQRIALLARGKGPIVATPKPKPEIKEPSP